MLKIGRLLNEMLGILTMGTSKFELLRVVLLHMVVHGILLLACLIAMGALEMTQIVLNVLHGRHLGKEKWRKVVIQSFSDRHTSTPWWVSVSIFSFPLKHWSKSPSDT
jgi:hypothetical protein